jgi:LPS sulfotransferase NodH
MTKFVVFTTPRTGSSLLIKTLDSHPEIFCAGELFFFKGDIYHNEDRYPFWRFPVSAKINYLLNYPKLFLTLPAFLNKFYRTDASLKAKGFKLMHFQTYYTPGIFSYLKRNDVKVIVLIRKNILRNTLSDLRARATKVYHNEGDTTTLTISKFDVHVEELVKKMRQIESFNKQLENSTADLERKIIYYEDFENWDETISGVLKYLNVANIPLKAASKKLNPDNLEDMVGNYQEMKHWLESNGYGKYLD